MNKRRRYVDGNCMDVCMIVTGNLPSCGNATMHAAPWHASRGGKEAGWLGAAITTSLSSPADTGSLGDLSSQQVDIYPNPQTAVVKLGRKRMFHRLIEYQRVDSLGQFAGTIYSRDLTGKV